MTDLRMKRGLAVVLAAALAAAAAAQDVGIKPDASAVCRATFKTPASVVSNSFHRVKDERTRRELSDELSAVLICDAELAKTPNACKTSMETVAKATGGPDAKLGGNLTARCEHAERFASFYREALSARREQRRFPACLEYFKHAQAVTVGAGFEDACAEVGAALRSRSADRCPPKLSAFAADPRSWPGMCKEVLRAWLAGDAGACANFPDPVWCQAETLLAPALGGGDASACPGGVEGGVCWAAAAKPRKTACRELWNKLQSDFCTELARQGMNGKDKAKADDAE